MLKNLPAKVNIILVLCGSGKSYRARQIEQATGARLFEGVASDDLYARLLGHLWRGRNATVEEVTYCDPKRREEFVEDLARIKGLEVAWECFENDLSKANWNVTQRTNKHTGGSARDPVAYNAALHPVYGYPPGARILTIHVIESSGKPA